MHATFLSKGRALNLNRSSLQPSGFLSTLPQDNTGTMHKLFVIRQKAAEKHLITSCQITHVLVKPQVLHRAITKGILYITSYARSNHILTNAVNRFGDSNIYRSKMGVEFGQSAGIKNRYDETDILVKMPCMIGCTCWHI